MTKALIKKDRAVLSITGSDAKDFLQGLITNDIAFADQAAIYAALLTPQGKFLFDFFVLKKADSYFLDTYAERANDLIKRLTMYKLRADVSIELAPNLVVACLWDGDAAPSGDWSFQDPRDEEMGVRVIGDAGSLAEDFAAAGYDEATEEDYLAHRISLTVPEAPHDIAPEKNFPLECNMEALNAISFTKGCYVGQEVTARSKHRGNVKKGIIRMESKHGFPPQGEQLLQGDTPIGTVLSVSGNQALVIVKKGKVDASS